MTDARHPSTPVGYNPFPGLWALVAGFFMILVDSTIVSVATPTLMNAFRADVNQVMWVTSAYLLAFAVPLLITGRLGDRFGPKRLYLTGLAIFTASSLWCATTGTIETLIVARIVQGLGASMMSPQTMAIITRTFAPHKRGQALAIWGASAGVATLVGPLLGGILIDTMGWEWIFLINVPIGLVGWWAAWKWVPKLDTRPHRFDWLGVVISGIGMFALIFGIQEGQTFHWGQIVGPISVPLVIGFGVVTLLIFLVMQWRSKAEPLVPFALFTDRNFTLAIIANAVVGFSMTATIFPLMLYLQSVRQLPPSQAALLMAPQALMSILFAPMVGRLVDKIHPRILGTFGTGVTALSSFLLAAFMHPETPTAAIIAIMVVAGLGGACLHAPLSATANRNVPIEYAGAASGLYNTIRQVGSVTGSAAIAMVMVNRMAEHPNDPSGIGTALGQAMVVPASIMLVAFVATLFFETPRHMQKANR